MRSIDIISVMVVSLSISFMGGNAQTTSANSVAYPWAGFYLALQWPAGFCSTDDSCNENAVLNTFNIHGLYPYNAFGEQITYCSGSEFNVTSVSEYVAELHLSSPSLVATTSDEELWAHEWDKHGKCSEALLSQTDYFKTAIAFQKAFNILGLLNAAGVYANDAFYQPPTIQRPIQMSLRAMPTFTLKTNKFSELVLTEIKLCLNQLATKFVDCPADFPVPEGVIKFALH